MQLLDAYLNFVYDVCMSRTTLEIDRELLERAKRALGTSTMRETVDVALRRATEDEETDRADRSRRQWHILRNLSKHIDPDVLASDTMWR